ncbi:hypothetical protein [Oceanicaulis sp.]|uniref:hypothetical protein n=1 Tax=Oceanicaulis sp. TaxID=1924941 RepID=UPI003D294882
MGKRSSFERRERDFYPTPEAAVLPLLPHLEPVTQFIEPCVGGGDLVRHLAKHGHFCAGGSDVERDARTHLYSTTVAGEVCFITNPPWSRDVLHPIITNLSAQAPTWLLFDAHWMHTRQAVPYLPLCRKIVSVGRVKWIPDSTHTGKDNCAWYLFDASASGPAQFIGRDAA